MEFTETYKQTGPCAFSPNARFLAVAVDYRLVIRDVLTLKVVQLFSCLDKITYIEWALDSEYILCGLFKRPMIQAWSLAQPEWTCKIDEGPAVWSLLNTACIHVQWPKHGSKGVSFTKDGKFAAICTRRDCKDYVNLLSCYTWEIMGVFAVDTLDLSDIQWSPDDSAIVIWDSPLEYKPVLSCGSYDQMIRVLNHLTWKVFAEFTHLSTVRGPCAAAVFKEVDEPLQLDMSELSLSDEFAKRNADYAAEAYIQFRYDVMEVPITLPSQKPAAEKPNPKQGIGLMSWSNDSQYICTRNDSMPTVLWIWDVQHLELAAILIQKDPVRAVAWDPTCPRLVLCTGSTNLYMWTPSGAYCINAPFPNFSIFDLKWNSDGSCLLLKDKESFCCAAVPLLQESSDYSSED
ncbi:UNVERIFIED_CONTAM: WD repeat-containing protein WRAP73 [Sesamum calycinum]|uniref:WD repeat-containing protein WRAP73 n=1 Tax=Sesamum calycinum TaxID=2727403 RepID=A0AAW2LSK1_9LAMI